jgi:hypothetical protein
MAQTSFTLGSGALSSPFSSLNNADYLSRYLPFNHVKSPLSGAFPADGEPGYSTGAGLLGTLEVKRSDSLAFRPIVFYSLSMPFTNASSNIQLEVATGAGGEGGVQGPTQADDTTVTWDINNFTSPLQYAVSQCSTADAASTFFIGFEKQDTNTTTFRRGATSNGTIAPNGIFVNGTSNPDWASTAVRATVAWRHIPNHPTSLSASPGTNPGEVNLSWTAPNDNGGYSVYGYRIAYKKTGSSTWEVYGTNNYQSPSNTAGTSETVIGLDPGQEYSFVVAGLNEVTDRYNGGVISPDNIYGNYTETIAHTGQNSNIATATATSAETVVPQFGAYDTIFSAFVPATPKVWLQKTGGPGGLIDLSAFIDGVPWVYDGTKWIRPLQVTGGTATTYTSGRITYTVRTFSSSGTLNVKECQGGLDVDYLIVGGGGGGGGRYNSGGGGAGGVLSGTTTLIANTAYPVIVGIGGTGGADGNKGLKGKDSSLDENIALGGGGGGSYAAAVGGDPQGLPGGSGGGNSGYLAGTGGLGTAGQGNNGGVGVAGGFGAGGGGGAGAVGSNGTSSTGGAGGVGVSNSITGSAVFYGGGGGGASYNSATVPQGGNGGGGNGAPGPNNSTGGVPTDGVDGRGGGGGGANGYGTTGATTVGGDGGDGIVIIRYISSIT